MLVVYFTNDADIINAGQRKYFRSEILSISHFIISCSPIAKLSNKAGEISYNILGEYSMVSQPIR